MWPSKSKVDKAGQTLRDYFTRPRSAAAAKIDPQALGDALNVVWEHRKSFAYPMQKVNANLRYYVKVHDDPPVVAQRHKRLPRIVVKLVRHPRMRLSQMQDVGGCRAILPTQEAAFDVLARITKNWDIVTCDNYVEHPRPSGYRAVHAIVKRDEVPIEVQLRTPGQQLWADEVERIDGRRPEAIKDGEGPEWIHDYLRRLAELVYAVDSGRHVDEGERHSIADLARRVELDFPS